MKKQTVTSGKKTIWLLSALVGLLISAAIVVGATYSLFTGSRVVNNHLKAGNLTVGLHRTAFTEYSLNDKGLLAEKTDTTPVDLVANAAPVFSVAGAVPMSWYQAEVAVSNDGSVAFEHSLRILWNDENASPEQATFAKQMKITVTYGDGAQKNFFLFDCENKENEIGLGVVLKGEYKAFKVKAEFLNLSNNNDVQNIALQFDLQVLATQYVEETK